MKWVEPLLTAFKLESTDTYCGRKFDVLKRLLANRGMLLACSRPNKELFLTEKGFPKTLVSLSDKETNVLLAQKLSEGSSQAQNFSNVIMVCQFACIRRSPTFCFCAMLTNALFRSREQNPVFLETRLVNVSLHWQLVVVGSH